MKNVSYFFLISIGAVLFSCTSGNKKTDDNAESIVESPSENGVVMEEKSINAMADISSASGSELTGKATFTTTSNGKVDFELLLENVNTGLHAVHLHENGDCSARC